MVVLLYKIADLQQYPALSCTLMIDQSEDLKTVGNISVMCSKAAGLAGTCPRVTGEGF